MKAAVAVGAARRFLVGDPDIQLIDVLAGRLIDALAAAEHLAARSEVVLDRSALESLGDRVEIGEIRVDPESGREFGVVSAMTMAVDDAPASDRGRAAARRRSSGNGCCRRSTSACAPGRGEFLAELRPAYPLFVRFGGIDYDNDDDAIAKLDDFIRHVQRILTTYGGNLLHLTLGDKGAYLYAVFGSPLAHEDDAARAAAAALELRELRGLTAVTDIQIGITYGRLAQRHVRPRATADVHLPRRCRQSRGASHVERARRADLRLRIGASMPPAIVFAGSSSRRSR